MLNTIHLRTFLAVIESGTFSAAADRLHMSQPAVSQHIKALEEQLDVRLFRRAGQQMAPTHAGESLADLAREMLALSDRAEEQIRGMRGQISGQVVIGCTPSSGELVLAPLLTAFRKSHPSVTASVTVAPIESLLEWLGSQRVQVVVAEEYQRRRGWEAHSLGVEPLLLLAPRGHQLLQQERVPPGTLKGLPLIMPRAGSPLRRTIEDGLRRRGISAAELHVALETDGASLMIRSVRDGLGLAFIPQARIPRGREFGVVDLGGIHLQQEWFAIRWRERSAPPAVQAWLQYLTSPEARTILNKEGLKEPRT